MKKILRFNESNFEKDLWWDKNYKRLIDTVNDIPHENWESLVVDQDDLGGVLDSTAKHKALYLLAAYSIEELEELISEYNFDDVNESKKEPTYDINDILAAVQYGFKYATESQNDGKSVPAGNILQWMMGRKKLIHIPKSWKEISNKYQ